jgi:hypothetical protein
LTKGEEISKQLVSEFRNLDLSLWFVSDFDIRISDFVALAARRENFCCSRSAKDFKH